MSFITLNNLNKQYKKGQNIIHDVSLAIEAGEFLVIVGPSGCGKSTLLRMVAGLEKVTAGTIHIDGRDVTAEEPGARDIAMVFQNYALYPHMTVYDNMAYGLRNRGMAEAEIKTRVDAAANSLQLTEYLPRRPNQLSGGQRQRVAMGRAIVRSPKAFLFDEPLSNLDAKLRTQMRVEIKRIQRELGTTSIYVTHDQVEAMTLADRLIVLNGGHIEQMGPPKALYEKPDTLFVAGFLGSPSMNFLPASSVIRGFEQAGEQVIYGIRPEHLLIQADATNSAVQLEARIIAIEHLGSDALVYAGVIGGAENDKTDLIIRTAADIQAEVGDAVHLGAHADQVHLFDQQSGRRILV